MEEEKLYNIYNEYNDMLSNPIISDYLKTLGLGKQSSDCFIVNSDVSEKHIEHLISAWYGLIGDGYDFYCFRYTLTYIANWLRDTHKINVFIGFRPNIKKWDSHYYDMNLNGEEYCKSRPMNEYNKDKIFNSADDALEHGITNALLHLINEK